MSKSLATNKLAPIHPGEILTEEFLTPFGITRNKLAIDLGIPASRVDQIAKGRRGITADTALRLGRYFGTTPQFWMNLQSRYDLDVASDAAQKEIERSVQPRNQTAA